MLRAIALSIALLFGIGTIIPLATNYAEAGQKYKRHKKKREWKGVKKYSKRWWQLYRRQERRKKARAQARRALRLRQIRLANARKTMENGDSQNNVARTRQTAGTDSSRAVLPSGQSAPKDWKRGQMNGGVVQYQVEGSNGSQIGSASIAVVGPALGGQPDTTRSKTVGGVATSSLRRTVIDKMVGEEGWVVNDFQKEIGGKNVYVVVAQSPGTGNVVQSRLFYFTEVDGKIYSVATNAPADNSMKLEQESEKVVNSLQRRNGSQQADLR